MGQAGHVATAEATEGCRDLTAAQSAGALQQIADHERPERQDVCLAEASDAFEIQRNRGDQVAPVGAAERPRVEHEERRVHADHASSFFSRGFARA